MTISAPAPPSSVSEAAARLVAAENIFAPIPAPAAQMSSILSIASPSGASITNSLAGCEYTANPLYSPQAFTMLYPLLQSMQVPCSDVATIFQLLDPIQEKDVRSYLTIMNSYGVNRDTIVPFLQTNRSFGLLKGDGSALAAWCQLMRTCNIAPPPTTDAPYCRLIAQLKRIGYTTHDDGSDGKPLARDLVAKLYQLDKNLNDLLKPQASPYGVPGPFQSNPNDVWTRSMSACGPALAEFVIRNGAILDATFYIPYLPRDIYQTVRAKQANVETLVALLQGPLVRSIVDDHVLNRRSNMYASHLTKLQLLCLFPYAAATQLLRTNLNRDLDQLQCDGYYRGPAMPAADNLGCAVTSVNEHFTMPAPSDNLAWFLKQLGF